MMDIYRANIRDRQAVRKQRKPVPQSSKDIKVFTREVEPAKDGNGPRISYIVKHSPGWVKK